MMTSETHPTPVLWQSHAAQAAHAAAYVAESAIDAERHSAVRRAVALIVEGRPGRARYELARSVMRQNRIAGGGTVEVEPSCPCGGRCEHGGAS